MPKTAPNSTSNQAHTIGPWYQSGRCTNATFIASEGPNGEAVALIYDSRREYEANARLVAAAPDLLAACKAIIDDEDIAAATILCSQAYYAATED